MCTETPRLSTADWRRSVSHAEHLACRTDVAAFIAIRARAERLEARVLLGQGEASPARGASAVTAASAIDRARERGRRSRPHPLDVRLFVICICECRKTAEVESGVASAGVPARA